jgi:hypothetical protein
MTITPSDCPADVRLQHPLELLPVAAFEHDLAQFQQHAGLTGRDDGRSGTVCQGGNGHLHSLPGNAGPADRVTQGLRVRGPAAGGWPAQSVDARFGA